MIRSAKFDLCSKVNNTRAFIMVDNTVVSMTGLTTSPTSHHLITPVKNKTLSHVSYKIYISLYNSNPTRIVLSLSKWFFKPNIMLIIWLQVQLWLIMFPDYIWILNRCETRIQHISPRKIYIPRWLFTGPCPVVVARGSKRNMFSCLSNPVGVARGSKRNCYLVFQTTREAVDAEEPRFDKV